MNEKCHQIVQTSPLQSSPNLQMFAVLSCVSAAATSLHHAVPRRALLTKAAVVSTSVFLNAAAASAEENEVALPKTGGYVQFCDESVMAPKAHGTSASPVQADLRWNVDVKTADRICNFNRHYAEYVLLPGHVHTQDRQDASCLTRVCCGRCLSRRPTGTPATGSRPASCRR